MDFLTIEEAKTLASQAEIKFDDKEIHSVVNNHLSVDFGIDVTIKFPTENAPNIYVMVNIVEKDIKNLSIKDVNICIDGLLTDYIITATDSDDFDRERFKLGYSNGYDQPEIMHNWLSNPERFIVEHSPFLAELKAYIVQHLTKVHAFNPFNTPLENYSLKHHMNKQD